MCYGSGRAAARRVDAQTLQASPLVRPGKVPREQVHPAHMLGALCLFGLLCANSLRFLFVFVLRYFFRKIIKSQDNFIVQAHLQIRDLKIFPLAKV